MNSTQYSTMYGYAIPLILFSLTLLFTTIKYCFFEKQLVLNFVLVLFPLFMLNTSVLALLTTITDLSSIGGFLLGQLTLVLAIVLFETLNLYMLQFVAFIFTTKLQSKFRIVLIATPLWILAVLFIVLSFVQDATGKQARLVVQGLLYTISGLLDIIMSLLAISVLKKVKMQLQLLNQKLNIDPELFVKRLTIVVYAKLILMIIVVLTSIFDPSVRQGYTAMASPDFCNSAQATQANGISKVIKTAPSKDDTVSIAVVKNDGTDKTSQDVSISNSSAATRDDLERN